MSNEAFWSMVASLAAIITIGFGLVGALILVMGRLVKVETKQDAQEKEYTHRLRRMDSDVKFLKEQVRDLELSAGHRIKIRRREDPTESDQTETG